MVQNRGSSVPAKRGGDAAINRTDTQRAPDEPPPPHVGENTFFSLILAADIQIYHLFTTKNHKTYKHSVLLMDPF